MVLLASEVLALVQSAAAFVVRHRLLPPVQSRLAAAASIEAEGSMTKGAMNSKPASLIPATASFQLDPPSVDFWIVPKVYSP